MAETVITELMPAARDRNIEVVMEPFPAIVLPAHAESILEILNNLIDNAIK
jgi:signal transduction histidine kinase